MAESPTHVNACALGMLTLSTISPKRDTSSVAELTLDA